MAKKPKYQKETPGKHASSTGGPGKRNVDQTSWRKSMQTKRIKFDDDKKKKFLKHFAKNSRMTDAAFYAGVTYSTAKYHLDNDPEFMEAFEEAKAQYRDRCVGHAQKLQFEGIKDPIIGGKDRDTIVGHRITYPVRLIEMELRRVEAGYTDRQTIDLNTKSSGVLVAPADKTPEQWVKEQEEKNKGRNEPKG